MIGYRDMTFCKRNDCKKFEECPRALTEEVLEKAHKWWGSENAPISIAFFKGCFEGGKNG